jgi:RNA polymerase sigma-70 factor (ECF subfamily)
MTEIEFSGRLLSLERILGKFAYSLTREKADAEDLVQETYLKALWNQDKYVNNENFQAWVLTIMKNTFINEYRRSSRMCMRNDQTEESFYINRVKSSGFDDPDSAYSLLEMSQIINQLNEKFRIVFKMHYNGYKYKEIASVLNLNIGTVKSRIFLSRKKLQEQLDM